MRAELALDVLRETGPAVDHRQEDPGDAQARVEAPLDEVDRAEQL